MKPHFVKTRSIRKENPTNEPTQQKTVGSRGNNPHSPIKSCRGCTVLQLPVKTIYFTVDGLECGNQNTLQKMQTLSIKCIFRYTSKLSGTYTRTRTPTEVLLAAVPNSPAPRIAAAQQTKTSFSSAKSFEIIHDVQIYHNIQIYIYIYVYTYYHNIKIIYRYIQILY